jgi:hypothetical protein
VRTYQEKTALKRPSHPLLSTRLIIERTECAARDASTVKPKWQWQSVR